MTYMSSSRVLNCRHQTQSDVTRIHVACAGDTVVAHWFGCRRGEATRTLSSTICGLSAMDRTWVKRAMVVSIVTDKFSIHASRPLRQRFTRLRCETM